MVTSIKGVVPGGTAAPESVAVKGFFDTGRPDLRFIGNHQ
jgi:hypothetical protein